MTMTMPRARSRRSSPRSSTPAPGRQRSSLGRLPLSPGRLPVLLALIALLVFGGLGCPGPSVWPQDEGFDDHTRGRLDTVDDFYAWSRGEDEGTTVVKFVIVGFGEGDEHLRTRYLDAHFYEFHDQWYWFRLVNGYAVPGARTRPLSGYEFSTVDEIVYWVRERPKPPPFGMRFTEGDRLYADYFYEMGVHDQPRSFGLGSLVHVPARSTPAAEGESKRQEELWLFELEYLDEIDQGELERFFAALKGSLPPEIGDKLRWVARSPDQERLAKRLQARDHALGDRVMSYRELAIPGEVQVYNPGLIAGRLRRVPEDPEAAARMLSDTRSTEILIFSHLPDELPPAAGLLTAIPQTPLAHINLLARNRGIPNAYLGGILDDPNLAQLARVHAPVLVHAERDNLVIEPIDEDVYYRYLELRRRRPPKLAPVAIKTLPYTIPLSGRPVTDMTDLRPVVGGKSAGFIPILSALVTAPDQPLAISIRPYAEHLAELAPTIEQILDDPEFNREPRLRYLAIVGPSEKKFAKRFPGDDNAEWLADFVAAHPAKKAARDPWAKLLERGGIRDAIRDAPLSKPASEALSKALRDHFGAYAATQGLRFRSSSTVEDVEGFNGAGLYDSNTGFLDPDAQESKKDRKKSFEWAVKKTWASYWSWEALEERRLAGIDHLAGHMGVLVHARFDDPLETANGVLTITLDLSAKITAPERLFGAEAEPSPVGLTPPASVLAIPLRVDEFFPNDDFEPVPIERLQPPTRVLMEVNVQAGALSVTNPPTERGAEVVPEVDRVFTDERGEPRIQRVARSSESDALILSDAELGRLFFDAKRVAELWLAEENRLLDPLRARRSVTLDMEFRRVAPGWPAQTSGDPHPARMVLKQSRSLEPGVPVGAEHLMREPIPRDLFIRARKIERYRCRGSRTRVEVLEITTDPMSVPDLGHSAEAFVASVTLEDSRSRTLERISHVDITTSEHPGMSRGGPWSLVLRAATNNVEQLELSGGLLRLSNGGAVVREEPAPCTREILWSGPEEFLRGLLPNL